MNWTQLQTMLWLRWRLTQNQWRRSGGLNAVITLITMTAAMVVALVGGVAGVAVGALAFSSLSPLHAMLMWDGLVAAFLLFWIMGLVTELQRSEIIDLSRLLHLPVSLRDAFILNYIASLYSLSLVMLLPAMLGLAAGLVLGNGPAMVLLFPLLFGFFFMITAWTYCLRGWLAALMVNKRRRRAIIMVVTMVFILLFQLPNLVINVWHRDAYTSPPKTAAECQEWLDRKAKRDADFFLTLDQAHYYVPLLWLPQGAKGLAEGRAWPAVWCALGMAALGAWGLRRAYRSTIRFYQGGEGKKVAPPRPAARTGSADGKIMVEWKLPAIPEDAAAMALACFRSMSRAAEVKMALVTNTLIFAGIAVVALLRSAGGMPPGVRPFVASAAVAVTFFGLIQVMFNHFGFDRSGFRALVLLPTQRRRILLGKNLALLPMALIVFAIYLGLATILAHLRARQIITAGFEFAGAFLAMSALGNLASILLPYRIAPGSLKVSKTMGMTMLLIAVSQMLLFPLVMAPVFLPAGLELLGKAFDWFPGAMLALVCASLLAAFSAFLYWLTLEPLGRLLQWREQKILEVVTQEVE